MLNQTEISYLVGEMKASLGGKMVVNFLRKLLGNEEIEMNLIQESVLPKLENGQELTSEDRQATVEFVSLLQQLSDQACESFSGGVPDQEKLEKDSLRASILSKLNLAQ